MFSSSPYAAPGRPSATAYRDIGATTSLDGASPHKLVSLLYAALAGQIAAARGALARRDVAEKGRAILHAVRIVEEGLQMPLDMAAGGVIASDLHALYSYLARQLTLANVRGDDALLAECSTLVATLRDGWDGIAEQVQTPYPRAA